MEREVGRSGVADDHREVVPKSDLTLENVRDTFDDRYLSARSVLSIIKMELDDCAAGGSMNYERMAEQLGTVSSKLTDLYELGRDHLL